MPFRLLWAPFLIALSWALAGPGGQAQEVSARRPDGEPAPGRSGLEHPEIDLHSSRGPLNFRPHASPAPGLNHQAPRPDLEPKGEFELHDGDRVILVGNTFAERAARYGHLEAALLSRWPKRTITFRNLGWSGDNVFGEARVAYGKTESGSSLLRRQIASAKPTVIFLAYGSNAAFGGPDGLESFLGGLHRLLDGLQSTRARLVLVSPTPFAAHRQSRPDLGQQNAQRHLYARAIGRVARQRGCAFVDLFQALSASAGAASDGPLTENGMHLSDSGHRRAAEIIEEQLGLEKSAWRIEIDSHGNVLGGQGVAVTEAHGNGEHLRFKITENRLPVGFRSDRFLRVRGLERVKRYALRIEGKRVCSAYGFRWNRGQVITSGPDFEQAERLRRAIVRKNRLFVQHWRPQNETHLFGPKKRREQGHCVREHQKLGDLIAAQDQALSKLLSPSVRAYEIAPDPGRASIPVVADPPSGPRGPDALAQAKALRDALAQLDLTATKWIWFPKGDPLKDPGVPAPFFRRKVTLPADRKVIRAEALINADDEFVMWVNGKEAAKDKVWNKVIKLDLKRWLRPGENILAVSARNVGAANPAGLIAKFVFRFDKGEPLVVVTDETWKTSDAKEDQWQKLTHDDSKWVPALGFADHGIEPWGLLSAGPPPKLEPSDPRAELAALKVANDFSINLFASEPMVMKPFGMNWDAQGRLWVATSTSYPHLRPGQKADDKIIILEDTDGDGAADESVVFADGLQIPTAVLPTARGAYVANSTELLFLEDEDGDGRADETRVILSGFGNEDTHHVLHTLRRGPDGSIYFIQSSRIHSSVETPWGVRRLRGSGVWKFAPKSQRLEVFMRGLVNPWGLAFDEWGRAFATDDSSREGICHLLPGAVFWPARADRVLRGLNHGQPELRGLELLSGGHLPESYRGSLVAGDTRSRRIKRYVPRESGSGFRIENAPDLLSTSHPAFRPVDLKMGPDGALYVADWYNPIIRHEEVNFFDPKRDRTRGRIWRITAKERPLAPTSGLADAGVGRLIEALSSEEEWTREQALGRLHDLPAEEVLPGLTQWIQNLQPGPERDGDLLQALWLYRSSGRAGGEPLLSRLLEAEDHRVRAGAVRALGDVIGSEASPQAVAWGHSRIRQNSGLRRSSPKSGDFGYSPASEKPSHGDYLPLLKRMVTDRQPQVRLEAVIALRQVRTAEAAEIAMLALEKPLDGILDYALRQTVKELKPWWLAKMESGEMAFGGNMRHAQHAIRIVNAPGALLPIVEDFTRGKMSGSNWYHAAHLVADLGGADEIEMLFDLAISEGPLDVRQRYELFVALERAAARRKLLPSRRDRIADFLANEDEGLAMAAMRLSGRWQEEAAIPLLGQCARNPLASLRLRETAIGALGQIGDERCIDALVPLCQSGRSLNIRSRAAIALSTLDVPEAARQAANMLRDAPEDADLSGLFDALVRAEGGPEALAEELTGKELPAALAEAGIGRAFYGGRRARPLTRALAIAGNLPPLRGELSADQFRTLMDDVKRNGDPVQGGRLFRRISLSCLECHSIAGAGGLIGPDLSFVGTRASPEYLAESILLPHKQLARGYETTVVATNDGRVARGTVLRETKESVTLRNERGARVRILLPDIKEKKTVPESLMPTGFAIALRADEFADLVRFLWELGRGPIRVPPRSLVRRYRMLGNSRRPVLGDDDGLPDSLSGREPNFAWTRTFSRIDGTLPLDELPQHRLYIGPPAPAPAPAPAPSPSPISTPTPAPTPAPSPSVLPLPGESLAFARFDVRVTQPGKFGLRFHDPTGLRLWAGNRELLVTEEIVVDAADRLTPFLVSVDASARRAPLQIETFDLKGSRAKPIYAGLLTREFSRLRLELSEQVGRTPLPRALNWATSLLDFLDWKTPENEALVHPNHVNWGRGQIHHLENILDRLREHEDPFPKMRGQLLKSYRSLLDDSLQTYAVSVPNDYKGDKPYPLLVQLHGHGGNRPFQGFPAGVKGGMIVAAPHGRGAMDYMLSAEQDVLQVIQDLRKDYNIDADRIILEGHSMGGTGSWNLGVKFPDLFCCIAPAAGNSNYHSFLEDRPPQWQPSETFRALAEHLQAVNDPLAYAENLGNLPTFCLHGAQDNVVRVSHASKMIERMKSCGYEPVYHEFKDKGHGGFPGPVMKEREKWMFSQKRNPRPRKIRFKTARLRYEGAYWLRIRQFDQFGKFAEYRAEQADDGAIRIEADNITELAIRADLLSARPEDRLTVWVNEQKALDGDPGKADEILLRRTDGKWHKEAGGADGQAASAKRKGLEGPVEDALLSPFVLVYGTVSASALWNRVVKREAEQFADSWERIHLVRPRVKADTEVTGEDLKSLNLILYGGPEQNAISARICPSLPTRMAENSIKLGGRTFTGPGLAMRVCYPNPLNPDRYVVVSASIEPEGLWQINNRFGNITGWVPLDNWNWFDYAIFDDRCADEDTVLCAGFFGPSWNVDERSQWLGDPGRRKSSQPRGFPKLAELPEEGSEPEKLWLSDLLPTRLHCDKGVVNFDRSYLGNDLRIGTKLFKRGFGTRAPSVMEFDIDGRYARFRTWYGIDLEGEKEVTGERAKDEQVEFFVYGDDRLRWQSGKMRWNQNPPPVDIDVKGVRLLRLEIEGHGRIWLFGSAAWGNPQLLKPSALRKSDALQAAPSLISKAPGKLEGNASASHNGASVSNALDGNPGTRWDTATPMQPGMWFLLDLKKEREVKAIELDSSTSPEDYPRGYAVYVTGKPNEPARPVALGQGDPSITRIVLKKPARGRYLKIVQTGSSDRYWWSIHELRISP